MARFRVTTWWEASVPDTMVDASAPRDTCGAVFTSCQSSSSSGGRESEHGVAGSNGIGDGGRRSGEIVNSGSKVPNSIEALHRGNQRSNSAVRKTNSGSAGRFSLQGEVSKGVEPIVVVGAVVAGSNASSDGFIVTGPPKLWQQVMKARNYHCCLTEKKTLNLHYCKCN